MESGNKFEYVYSAPTEAERREIEEIRRRFLPADKTETKLDKLRRLDAKVNRAPKIAAVSFGIGGTLVAGLGMALVLEWNAVAWGVAVGLCGVAIAIAAYPVFKAVLNRKKRKYGAEILRLGDEILNGDGSLETESEIK